MIKSFAHKTTAGQVLVCLTLFGFALASGQQSNQAKSLPGPDGNRLSIEQLSADADVIASGKVTSLKSEWSKDKSRIITRATVAVDDLVKGQDKSGSIVVTYPGGEVDGVGELYSHNVTFIDQEEVLLFARKDQAGDLRIVGGQQGKLTVKTDKSTGKKLLPSQTSLDEVKAQVRSILKSEKNK